MLFKKEVQSKNYLNGLNYDNLVIVTEEKPRKEYFNNYFYAKCYIKTEFSTFVEYKKDNKTFIFYFDNNDLVLNGCIEIENEEFKNIKFLCGMVK